MSFDLSHYSYDYPEELVAQFPATQRENSRLLVRTRDGLLKDNVFSDLVKILPRNTLLVFNESKVFPCRIRFQCEGFNAELFLLECIESSHSSIPNSKWKALLKPLKKLKRSSINYDLMPFRILFDDVVEFDHDQREVLDHFAQHGDMPLPPYIHSRDHVDRYQTVYAKTIGSVAAPTAGLHFSESVMKELTDTGIELAFVCLHVGAGTFLPVRSTDIREHVMHTEHYYVSQQCASKIENHEGPIIAVGTTSFRAVESFFADPSAKADTWMKTQLFVYPGSGFQRKVLNGIITNFHQPESTLIMMISALIGRENVLSMYQYAIDQRYRLFSFGDATLLWL